MIMELTTKQTDALKEMVNIGVGRGIEVLNTMLESHICLSVPFVNVLSKENLSDGLDWTKGEQLSTVTLPFKGNFNGTSELIFPSEGASKLITSLTGEESLDGGIDSLQAGTLCEVGNIVLNAVMGSVSNLLELQLDYTVPGFLQGGVDSLLPSIDFNSSPVILLAKTSFTIDKLEIDGGIALFLESDSFDKLIDVLDSLGPQE